MLSLLLIAALTQGQVEYRRSPNAFVPPGGKVHEKVRSAPTSGGAAVPSSLLTGLAAYWAFEADSTDATGSHNGTDTGVGHVVVYATGKIGNAWSCPTTNNCRTTFSALTTSTTFTISLWLKPVSPVGYTDGFGTMIGQDGNNAFFMNNAHPKLYPATSAGGSVVAGTWIHLLLTADGATATYYLNGVADGTTGAYSSSLGLAMIGASAGTGSECIAGTSSNGMLDEIGVWTRVLTPTEIATLYNSGAGKTYPFN